MWPNVVFLHHIKPVKQFGKGQRLSLTVSMIFPFQLFSLLNLFFKKFLECFLHVSGKHYLRGKHRFTWLQEGCLEKNFFLSTMQCSHAYDKVNKMWVRAITYKYVCIPTCLSIFFSKAKLPGNRSSPFSIWMSSFFPKVTLAVLLQAGLKPIICSLCFQPLLASLDFFLWLNWYLYCSS